MFRTDFPQNGSLPVLGKFQTPYYRTEISMKYLFTGGGTAGHITPALAVAEVLRETEDDAEILFVGREGGAENERVRALGYKVRELPVAGFERRFTMKNVKAILTLCRGLGTAGRILDEERPAVILGTGGYVSYPILHVGARRGISVFLHESNAAPGLAARRLAARCEAVLLGVPGSEGAFPASVHTEVVGNPVRRGFCERSKKEEKRRLGIPPDRLMILSFGGSLGSERMNELLLSFLAEDSSEQKKILHIHATGERYFSSLPEKYKRFTKGGGNCRILPYIDDMPRLMRAADIVISRGGAMTLSELAVAECAAILIPSPNVTENHQYKNAKHLSDAGAAILIEETELSEKSLTDAVRLLETDAARRLSMSRAIARFAMPGAAEKIAKILKSAAAGEKSR